MNAGYEIQLFFYNLEKTLNNQAIRGILITDTSTGVGDAHSFIMFVKENIMDQISRIKEMIAPLLASDNIKLYDVVWHTEGSNRILQIAIMQNDGSMDIDTCAQMSEKISEKLDEEDIIASEYFLEVCSPGAERELRDEVQIREAVGEYVYVKLKNPKAGMDEVKGTMTAFENNIVYLDYMAKAVKKKTEIEMENIALIRLSVKI